MVAFERSRLALAPLISSRRKYWFPRLDMPPNRFFWLAGELRTSPHCALANQPLPTSVQQHSSLLFSRFGGHEAHQRVGRETASQMASASAASFLFRLT